MHTTEGNTMQHTYIDKDTGEIVIPWSAIPDYHWLDVVQLANYFTFSRGGDASFVHEIEQ